MCGGADVSGLAVALDAHRGGEGGLKYCKRRSTIQAALNKFEERLGLTAEEAIAAPGCLERAFVRPSACPTKFFHMLLQCGERSWGGRFPENLKSLLFCNTCGILNFMLIYRPLLPLECCE